MAQASTPNSLGEGIGMSGVGEVLAALLLVVLVIFAIAWALRRLQAGGVAGGGPMKVVAGLSVGPRERLLVVEVGGTQLLLGVTATQISRLHEFPEPVVDTHRPGVADFALRMRQALGKGPTS